MCAVDHADFSLRAFLPASPHLFYPLPFDVPGPSSLIQRASQTAQPSPARPPPPPRFVILAAPSRGGLADRLLCRSPLRGLIDGCAPPRFSHRSHCFAKGGKSRSNIFHISSPGRRIDVDVCSIHPQKPGTLSEHVTSAAPRGCNSPLRRGGHVGGAFSHEGQRCNRACWAHRWEEPRAPLAFNARLFFDPIGQQFL